MGSRRIDVLKEFSFMFGRIYKIRISQENTWTPKTSGGPLLSGVEVGFKTDLNDAETLFNPGVLVKSPNLSNGDAEPEVNSFYIEWTHWIKEILSSTWSLFTDVTLGHREQLFSFPNRSLLHGHVHLDPFLNNRLLQSAGSRCRFSSRRRFKIGQTPWRCRTYKQTIKTCYALKLTLMWQQTNRRSQILPQRSLRDARRSKSCHTLGLTRIILVGLKIKILKVKRGLIRNSSHPGITRLSTFFGSIFGFTAMLSSISSNVSLLKLISRFKQSCKKTNHSRHFSQLYSA